MHIAAEEAIRRKRRQLKERGAGIDQKVAPIARQHLAARLPCMS